MLCNVTCMTTDASNPTMAHPLQHMFDGYGMLLSVSCATLY